MWSGTPRVTISHVRRSSTSSLVRRRPASIAKAESGTWDGTAFTPSGLVLDLLAPFPGVTILQPGDYRVRGELAILYEVTGERSVNSTFAWALQPADTDGDGVKDFEDNCPNVANPGEEDSNGDGIRDACGAAPIAVCNGPLNAEADNPDGAMVQRDTSQSYHPDGDPISYHWDVSDAVMLDANDFAQPSGVFPIGITTATLTVADGRGGVSTCDMVVTVEDTTPPQVQCTSDIAMLWPPNHTMRPVTIDIAVSDLVGVSWDTASITIRSDESDDAVGNGDGATTDDVDGADGVTTPVNVTGRCAFDDALAAWVGTVQLRAEREGASDGRCSTIECSTQDDAGDAVVTSCCTVVPHDQRPQ